MKNTDFNTEKTIGILLIIGALAFFVPYTLLTITFDYPTILREEPSMMAKKANKVAFQASINTVVLFWGTFRPIAYHFLDNFDINGFS